MADTKTTALTALTAPESTDLLMVIDDPSGTPASKKITIADLQKAFGAVSGTGATILFDLAIGRIYNATTPSSAATVTLDFTGAVAGGTAIFVSDGTAVTISSSKTVYTSGTQKTGEQGALFLMYDGTQVYANWVPAANAVQQLSTPTVALAVGDTELDYTISGEDANATGGVFEYSVNGGSSWSAVSGYAFSTKTGTITGLTNGVEVTVRLRNTAGGYFDSEYGTDAETPAGAVSSLLTSLAAYWNMEEASGARVDEVGGISAADNNTVPSTIGKVGSLCADFTAANSEYLSVADNATLSMGDIDCTIACWVNLKTKATMSFVDKYVSTGDQREYTLGYDSSGDRFRFVTSRDGTGATTLTINANSFGAPSTGTWYFLLAEYDATSNLIKISVNNGTADSAAQAAGPFDGTASFTIGASGAGTGNFANALIDEIGIWKRLLTSGEKASLYNSGSGVTYPFS